MNVDLIIDNICNNEIQNKKINKQPLCILIGGLPGAGKTNLIEKVKLDHTERDFIIIDADDYRRLHPDYENLIKTPEKAITETISFANSIEAELIKRAIKNHYDFISVTTLRATDAINKIVYEPAIENGYKIETDIMSVPIRESGLSAQIRYERQIDMGEYPRFTPMSFIESSYAGIQDTIKVFQNKHDGNIIKVYNRGQKEDSMPIEVYNSANEDFRYRNALEAFLNPKKNINHQNAVNQIDNLYKIKEYRGAANEEYASLERLQELFEIERTK